MNPVSSPRHAVVVRLAAIVFLSILASACAPTLQQSILGEWKGHLTMKSPREMNKRAATFNFRENQEVSIRMDNGDTVTNLWFINDGKHVFFRDTDSDDPIIRWEPILSGDVLQGPLTPLKGPGTDDMTLNLRLQRVAK